MKWWEFTQDNGDGSYSKLRFRTEEEANAALEYLITNGSVAAPGYMNIEGAVMYEPDTDTCFKIIINK